MLLARAAGHNLQVYDDLYQANNLDGRYLTQYAQEPKLRSNIRDIMAAEGFMRQALKSTNASRRLQGEFSVARGPVR